MLALVFGLAAVDVHPEEAGGPAGRQAFFGNFHVHTGYSFDAYTNGSATTPDDAYRWARGGSIPGGGDGSELQTSRPLDWYAVSDHAEFLGVFPKLADPDSPLSRLPVAAELNALEPAEAFRAFARILIDRSTGKPNAELTDPAVRRSIWREIVETADAHYQPGTFTTFPAYEWTSNPERQNLHRVVVFGSSEQVPALPFSAFDSDRPGDLWDWMDGLRREGGRVLAIPHNGNASNGLMFPEREGYGGTPLDAAYAQTRSRNEPVYEITQVKGTSESHPVLSPTDEFAGFELWDYSLSADGKAPERRAGGYARRALIKGLELESRGAGNPYRFGFIGDSDAHNAASMVEEDNFHGKFAMENDPSRRLNGAPGMDEADRRKVREYSSGGLAGIWAEANTREALFDAVLRRETFATTGPRISVRFFGGFGYGRDILESADWVATAYSQGVPMGGELRDSPASNPPVFLVMAAMEPDGAHLDRIQIVKGWVERGELREKIFNVAWSGDRRVGNGGSLPPVGDTVDAAAASYDNSIGAAQLAAVWTDPAFDPAAGAVYYARVLQIPTPRWSTYDAKTLGISPREDLPVAIQERAWSSPIWYRP